MNATYRRAISLLTATAVLCGSAQALPASHGQTGSPQQQPPNPPKQKPSKKPEEPIDPDTSAGVRGPGSTHTVRVLRKGKPMEGAHVVVKNTNGSVAASCYTSASGECQVDVGADSYVIDAAKDGSVGTVSLPVNDATRAIVIRLTKAKKSGGAPK